MKRLIGGYPENLLRTLLLREDISDCSPEGLESALLMLDDEQVEVIALRYHSGLPFDGIRRRMCTTLHRVKTTHDAALRRLRSPRLRAYYAPSVPQKVTAASLRGKE